MKKTISMFLAVIMLLTVLFVPFNIVKAYSESYPTRYVFDFGGKDNFNYVQLVKGQESSGTAYFTPTSGVGTANVKPVYAPTNYTYGWNSGSVSYKQVQLNDSSVNALNISFSNDGIFVPMMSNGKPFELEPGHSYSIKISYTQDGDGYDTEDSWNGERGLYAATGLIDPALVADSLKYAREYATVPFGSGFASRPVSVKIDDLYSVATDLYTYSFTLTAPAASGTGYTYNADKNAYNATATITSASGGGNIGDTVSLDFYNYLYFYFNHYGKCSINITELEITRDDFVPDWDSELEDKYVFDIENMGYYADVPNKAGQTVLDDSYSWNYAPTVIDPGLGRAKRNIYPVYSIASTMNWGPQTWAKPFTIEYDGAAYDSWRIQNSNPSYFTPLKDDGTPFELAPGHTYTVHIKYYVNYYEASNPFMQYEVGVPENGYMKMNSSTFLLDSSIISGRIGWLNGNMGTMQESTFTITTPSGNGDGYTYNASQNTYTKTIDGTEYTLYNYLYFSLTNYSNKPIIDLVALDIIRDDYSVKADVNYIDADGTVLKTVSANVGEFTVDYIPDNTAGKVFAGWYLDSGYNTPAGATVNLIESGINLYAKWKEVINWSTVLDKHYVFDIANMGYYSDVPNRAGQTLLDDTKNWNYSPEVIDAGYDRGNRNIYALYGTTSTLGWGPQNYAMPSTVEYEGKTYNTWQVQSKNPGMFMPMKADGTPFEVAPGHTYTVKIKYYMTSYSSGNPFLHLNVGVPSDGTFMRNNSSEVLLALIDQRFGWIYGEVGTMVEKTVSITVPEADASYNALDNTFTKNYDGTDYTLYNYLYFSLPNYGVPVIDIVYLEISRDDYVAQGLVEYIDADGTILNSATYNVGDVTIDYTPANKADSVFAGWYLDAECNTPAGNTVYLTETGIKLYAKWKEKVNWSAVLDKHYVFSISAMGNYSDVANSDTSKNWTLAPITINAGFDRGNRSIYPTYALTSTYGWGAQSFAHKSTTMYNGNTVDAITYTNKNPGFFMPLKEDGTPFEFAPGHTYTIKYVYEPISIAEGNPILQVSSGISANAIVNIKQHDDGIYYNDISTNSINNAWLASDIGNVVEKVCSITIPAEDDPNYNAYDNTYNLSYDGVDYTLYNYLYFYMGNYGKASVNFISIEVLRDDHVVKGTVEYIGKDDFVLKSDVVNAGEYAINYVAANTETEYFAGWYSNADRTQKVESSNVVVTESGIKLYAKYVPYATSITSANSSYYFGAGKFAHIDGNGQYKTTLSTRSSVSNTTIGSNNNNLTLSTTAWGDGILLTAYDDTTGELFRAKPNTTYAVTVKFKITAETTREDGIEVYALPGVGISNGKYYDENSFTQRATAYLAAYTAVTDGFVTYKGVITTGALDSLTSLPAIGVEFWIYQNAAVEIESFSVYEVTDAQVKYVVDENGTVAKTDDIKFGQEYAVNYIPANTDTKYFAGWYLDNTYVNEVTSATVNTFGEEFFLYAKWEDYKTSSSSVTNSLFYSTVKVPFIYNREGTDIYSVNMSNKSGLQLVAESDENKTTFSVPNFWGTTALLTAKDNETGELFRAAPNTAYKITLKFRVVSDTIDDTRDYSVSVTPGAGLVSTSDYPMGKFNDQIQLAKHGTTTQYSGVTADGEVLTYNSVYATGDFDTIPAIGVQLFLFNGAVVEVYELSVQKVDNRPFENGSMLISDNVSNNTSYKVNFTYMLTKTPENDIGIGFKTTASDGIGYPTFIEGQNKAIFTIPATMQLGVSHFGSAIFTTDMYAGIIADGQGNNDTLSALNSYLYAYLTDISCNDYVLITGIDVVSLGTDVVTVKGGQALNAEAELKENCQAIRYSFGYKSKFGDTIIIDGVSYKVKERGFIYANGNNYANKSGDALVYTGDMNVGSAAENNKYIVKSKTSGLTQCWAVEDVEGQPYYEIQFSTYVTNFAKDDTRELLAKAYVVLELGGQNFTVYSNFINRSVSYIKSINDANIDPSQRQLVWGYDFSKIEDISEVTAFHQNNNRNNFANNEVQNPVIGGNNYVIEDGALKLKITYSDTDTTGAKYDMPVTLTTKDRMSFKYGYLELEATLPYERGIHQGFWLAPQNEFINAGAYEKLNAEVDIFEVDGIYNPYSPSNTSSGVRGVPVANLHKWYHYYEDGVQKTGTSNLGMFRYNSAIAKFGNPFGSYDVGSTAYTDDSRYTSFRELSTARQTHRYGFEWTPEYMAFYIDPVVVNGVPTSEPYLKVYIDDDNYFYTSTEGHENTKRNDCFHEEQYILFSFCPIGTSNSNYGGDYNNAYINDIIALAAERQGGQSIDYTIHSIKLYQRLDGSETLTVK